MLLARASTISLIEDQAIIPVYRMHGKEILSRWYFLLEASPLSMGLVLSNDPSKA